MTRHAILRPLARALALGSIFSSSVFSASALDLSKPLAGDWRCGSDAPCQISQLFPQLKDVYLYGIIIIALIALIAGISAMYSVLTAEDGAAKMAEAKKNLTRSLVGLVVIAFLGTIFVAIFETMVKPKFNYVDDALSRIMEVDLFAVQHAFAQSTGTGEPTHLPNALVFNSFYDVIIAIYQLAMRWVLIPILIASWVWAGFLFIYARGNPAGLKYAKSRLFRAAVVTLILSVGLGLVYAFKGTFNQIFS